MKTLRDSGVVLPETLNLVQGWQQWRPFVKQFAFIIVVLIVVIGVVLFSYETYQLNVEHKLLMEQEVTRVRLAKKELSTELNTAFSDLEILIESLPLREFLDSSTIQNRQRLAKLFTRISSPRKVYDQIRYLDANGREVVRINYDQDKAVTVPQDQLRNKSKRYYFADTFRLARGQIFVSPLDLNIEGMRIERPLKPMLRIGAPVFDSQGQKQGIVMLNYLGQVLIDRFRDTMLGATGTPMFLNSKGYWFLGRVSDQEWGFMFNNNKTFERQYPQAWSNISHQQTGQFWIESGLFSFETVNPLLEGQASSSGTADAWAGSGYQLQAEDYAWKVVSHVDKQTTRHFIGVHHKKATLTLFVFLLVLVPIAWLFFRSRVMNYKADFIIKRIAAEEHALGQLLRLSLQPMEMKEFLRQAMDSLVNSVPWLNLLPKGAVFLTEDRGKGKTLRLAANYQTASEQQSVCPEVPFGACLCGFAAESRKIQFATRGRRIQEKCIPEIMPHQVYNVPILSEEDVFGVLLLYLPDGHRQENYEKTFLHKVADVLSMGIKLRYNNDSLVHAKESAEAASDQLKNAQEELTALTHQLQEQNHELTKSNKELDDFAYIASHDLKEPLRGIHNYSIFLLEDYEDRLDEQGRHMLQTLTRLTQRMECLIDSLLHFSRLGRTEMAMEEVSLQATVEDVLESLFYSLEEKGVEIRIPEKLPTVYCDSARVGEIYRNLITNAMKYNDKPQKWIEIGYQGLVSDVDTVGCQDSEIVFHVRDNGIGIKQKHQESIFRIFKRLHGRDKFGGGTGAGLTIVKKIVERHGGCITSESFVGEGTTFYFTLGDRKSGKGKCDHPVH
ncbi:MAG: ATP-binding protein [Pseudomonadota bacterium]